MFMNVFPNLAGSAYLKIFIPGRARALDMVTKVLDLAAVFHDMEQKRREYCSMKTAIKSGCTSSMLELLLVNKADPNNSNGGRSWPILNEAVVMRKPEMARLLLDHHADPNGMPGESWTPLLLAVTLDHLEVTKTLIARGADVTGPGPLLSMGYWCTSPRKAHARRFLWLHVTARDNAWDGSWFCLLPFETRWRCRTIATVWSSRVCDFFALIPIEILHLLLLYVAHEQLL